MLIVTVIVVGAVTMIKIQRARAVLRIAHIHHEQEAGDLAQTGLRRVISTMILGG